MSKDQKSLKQSSTALEDKWRNGTNQKVLGSKIVVNEASKIASEIWSPACMEFTIQSNEVLSFGPNSRFNVKGKFEVKRTAVGEWERCAHIDGADVIINPNWWEMLIKDFEIWHSNNKIASSEKGRFVLQYLNTFWCCFTNEEQKKILCPEKCQPGNGVPTKVSDLGWNNANGASKWRLYANKILKVDLSVQFSWTPLNSQPFYQFLQLSSGGTKNLAHATFGQTSFESQLYQQAK